MTEGPSHAERAVETAVRTAYGRLVALLASRTGDVAAAEDALSDALAAALRQWPVEGVPQKPEAWLIAVAKRRLMDDRRRVRVRELAADRLAADATAAAVDTLPDDDALPDARLALLFACAHPALDPSIHTPLMLQAVLGMEAPTIAAAFLVAPATMAQRLVRAKAKIRDGGIRIDPPTRDAIGERLPAVLQAIYAAYGTAWEDAEGAEPAHRDLGAEAIWLARVVVELLPGEPEALGLLALLLYCESRRSARRAADGTYVPLDQQDSSLWDAAMVEEAEALLWRAAIARQPGRFQLEAAIQSLHAGRLRGTPPPPAVLTQMYEALLHHAPSAGACVAHAAAMLASHGAEAALRRLDEIGGELRETYQPWWAVRAQVLAALGDRPAAADAWQRAAGLTENAATRAWLLARAAGD